MSGVYVKDPDARLDYMVDWSDWLAEGDTIVTAQIDIAPQGELAVDGLPAVVGAGAQVQTWLTGGVRRKRYTLTCRVTTAAGRTDDRTSVVFVEER